MGPKERICAGPAPRARCPFRRCAKIDFLPVSLAVVTEVIEGIYLVTAPYMQLWLVLERGIDPTQAANISTAVTFGIGLPSFFLCAIAADMFSEKFGVNRFYISAVLQACYGATQLISIYVPASSPGWFWFFNGLVSFFASSWQAPFCS